MKKTIYKIDGEQVSEEQFLYIAIEGAEDFITTCIEDNQIFTFKGHRFLAESYEVSKEELDFIKSLDSIIEKVDNVTLYRNKQGYLYMGYYFDYMDSILFLPLKDTYFPFIGEEETLSIEEVKEYCHE